ncbi:MAG: amidohydrolase family protein [Alphaproteobacteria bacterium]|nr:amidohydrolase family protein [Alphaproteobacteria bacterium]
MTSVIDIHAHLNVPAAQRMMKAAAERGDVSAAARNQGGIGITGERSANEMVLSDPEWRIKDMDKMGVDIGALSSGAPKGFYEADTNLAMTVAQHINDHAASVVKAYPDRFVAMAIAPLQHVDLAIKETERAVRTLGLKPSAFPATSPAWSCRTPSSNPTGMRWKSSASPSTSIPRAFPIRSGSRPSTCRTWCRTRSRPRWRRRT